MGRTAGYCALLLVAALAISLGDASQDASLQCLNVSPCFLKCGGACSTSARSTFGVRGTARVTSERTRSAGFADASSMQDIIQLVTGVAEQQALATTQQLRPNQYPDSTDPVTGQWNTAIPGRWTSG